MESTGNKAILHCFTWNLKQAHLGVQVLIIFEMRSTQEFMDMIVLEVVDKRHGPKFVKKFDDHWLKSKDELVLSNAMENNIYEFISTGLPNTPL